MDLTSPFEKTKPKKKPPSNSSNPQDEGKDEGEETNIYTQLVAGDEEDEDRDEDDIGNSLDDDPDDEFDEEVPWFKKPIVLAGIVGGLLIVGVASYFLFFKEDPPPPPPPEEAVPVEEVDPALVLKDNLYQMGIGKEAVNEKNIYEQGPIESADFRKDFVSTEAPENYTLPIEIMGVNDSVSYTKHRTMTDDGIDMYWVDAEYKGKKSRFTVPYYIWQTLAPQGVMDVIVETVIDAEGKTFITSITAVPPSAEE